MARLKPPSPIRLLAKNLRCLWRRWHLGRRMPVRSASAERTLIIAPHPDDETFGCGALISLKRAAGVPVRVIFLTGGGTSLQSLSQETPEQVAQARKSQALAACGRLGVSPTELRWLALPDRAVPRRGQAGFEDIVQRLLSEISDFSPGEVFCTHPEDGHADHEAAAELVHEAVRLSKAQCCLIHYPMWIWYYARWGLGARLPANGWWRLDSGPGRAPKTAAVAEYLDAPRSPCGIPYCGSLPWSFLWNVRHQPEVFFEPALSA